VHRLAYYADGDGTIVLLTVWRRWRGARHECRRAATAMRRRTRPDREPDHRKTEGGTERSGDESP
jgi:hypothetical protein